MYSIILENPAKKFIKKLDCSEQKKILKKIKKLKENPRLGKPLTGSLSGLFRLRIEKYRIIYSIEESKLIIFILRGGLRKNIYR